MNKYINPQNKILRHFDRLADWQNGKLVVPIGVEIDLSNRCNEGCDDCHFGYTHQRGPLAHRRDSNMLDMGDLMDFNLFIQLLQELEEIGVKSVTLSGGGEPTLHPQFKEILEWIKANSKLQFGLYTNGTRITPELASLMSEVFTWIVVSLDEYTPERYLKYKKVDLFQKACEGIKLLAQNEDGATIGTSFLLTEGNYKHIKKMLALHRSLNSDYAEFRPMVNFDLANPAVPLGDTTWIVDAIPDLMQLGQEEDVEVSIPKFARYANWTRKYHTCSAILFTGVITPNGKVWTCVNRRGFPDSAIGDLNTESFLAIWARQKEWTDFSKCRVLCRGDALNLTLEKLQEPMQHETFI